MKTFSRSILGLAAVLALAGAFAPAFTSAQTTPYYYGNCNNTYQYTNNTYPYNYNYQYGNCPPSNLFVYVQVNAPANSYYSRKPSDFTVTISGATAYPQTFPGSSNGQMVSVVGTYSVTAASFEGFTASYSSGCAGTLVQNQQTSCVITENPIYPYNYQYPQQYTQQYPYYTTPVATPYVAPAVNAPTVYVTPAYIPRMPNTGFEPQTGAAIAFAAVALIAMAFLFFPYVRKALAVVLG